MMLHAHVAWPQTIVDFGYRGLTDLRITQTLDNLQSEIHIPLAFYRFFDSSPNFFASSPGRRRIGYDPLGIKVTPNSLEILS